MKRIVFAALFLLIAGTLVYAQQASSAPPTADQTRQSAQQFLNNGKSTLSQFDSDLNDFKTRNSGNDDASYFSRLSYEIRQLETRINSEGAIIKSLLDKGNQASSVRLARYENLMGQYRAKLAELESFTTTD